jgi:hypothetical protein
MLVNFYTRDGTLLCSRPQDSIPDVGEEVPQRTPEGGLRHYWVTARTWPLPAAGVDYYSLRDAPHAMVDIVVEERACPVTE